MAFPAVDSAAARVKAEAENNMERISSLPREGYKKIVADQGLIFHTNTDGSRYWSEEAYYLFTTAEIERLHEAARELHQMFLAAAEHVVNIGSAALGRLGLPAVLHAPILRSWQDDQWEFYGRFDLTLDAAGTPKLIEYNADTPTGLLEAAVIQWYWKEDCFPHLDQYNRIHEALIERWRALVDRGQIQPAQVLHLTATAKHPEDRMTTGYVAQLAETAGLKTRYLPVNQIGWDKGRRQFVDLERQGIRQMFKLYPWEWLAEGEFAAHLAEVNWMVLEPAWKAILASKRLLLVLQELYPNHPYLLRVAEQPCFAHEVRKPIFGREGANVRIFQSGRETESRMGGYGDNPVIYQEFCPLIRAGNYHAQCGVWMAGPDPVGMGIREDSREILGNTSQFVPHAIG
jgi:glutathionylspermidine synthase